MEVVGFVCRPWTSGEFNSKFLWFYDGKDVVDKARGSWGSREGDDLGVVLFCSSVRALVMDYEVLRGWVLEECDLKWIMKQVLIWVGGC